jgi:phage-related protein
VEEREVNPKSGTTGGPPAINPMEVFAPVMDALKLLGEKIKDLEIPINRMLDQWTLFGKTIRDMAGPFTKFVDQFTLLGKTLSTQFVSIAANTVEVFKSFKNLLATIGEPAIFAANKIKNAFVGLFEGRLGDVLRDFGDKISGLFQGKAAEPVRAFIDKVAGAFQGRGADMVKDYVGKAMGAISSFLGTAGKALGAVAGAGGAAIGAIVGLGEVMSQFVGLASPAVLQMFTTALQDMMAVIGQAMLPIMEAITPIIRLAADTLSTFVSTIGSSLAGMVESFMPVLRELFDFWGREGQVIAQVFQAMTPVVQQVAEVFGQLWKAIDPVYELLLDVVGNLIISSVRLLADVLKAIVPIITAVATAVRDLLQEFSNFVRDIFGFKELTKRGEGTKPNASLNAAVRNVSVGTLESNIQSAQKSAFMLGTAGAAKPEEKTATATEGIFGLLGRMWAWIQSLPEKIWNFVKTGFRDVVNALGSIVPSKAGVSHFAHDVSFGLFGTSRASAGSSSWGEDREIAGSPVRRRGS